MGANWRQESLNGDPPTNLRNCIIWGHVGVHFFFFKSSGMSFGGVFRGCFRVSCGSLGSQNCSKITLNFRPILKNFGPKSIQNGSKIWRLFLASLFCRFLVDFKPVLESKNDQNQRKIDAKMHPNCASVFRSNFHRFFVDFRLPLGIILGSCWASCAGSAKSQKSLKTLWFLMIFQGSGARNRHHFPMF